MDEFPWWRFFRSQIMLKYEYKAGLSCISFSFWACEPFKVSSFGFLLRRWQCSWPGWSSWLGSCPPAQCIGWWQLWHSTWIIRNRTRLHKWISMLSFLNCFFYTSEIGQNPNLSGMRVIREFVEFCGLYFGIQTAKRVFTRKWCLQGEGVHYRDVLGLARSFPLRFQTKFFIVSYVKHQCVAI